MRAYTIREVWDPTPGATIHPSFLTEYKSPSCCVCPKTEIVVVSLRDGLHYRCLEHLDSTTLAEVVGYPAEGSIATLSTYIAEKLVSLRE